MSDCNCMLCQFIEVHHKLTAELREERAEVEQLRATLDAVGADLLKTARLYQADDGSPGQLSNVWGWRVISEHLRKAAEAAGSG